MKQIAGIAIIIVASLSCCAQSKDKPAIPGKPEVDKLCGCFDVTFKYAETFSPDKDYKFHDREEIKGGTEYIFPVESSGRRIIMQHLLVVTDEMIVKHWREDWTYEDSTIWVYKGNQTWIKQHLAASAVKGKWTQSVWEVSDAPRYQGVSPWLVNDDKTYWESTVDAPLPRREYSVRSDYNVLRRNNRLVIDTDGWTHEQDNQKVIRKNGVDQLLVEEKGINSYKRIDDSKCAAAKAYWEKNKTYWTRVRIVWEEYLSEYNLISLKDKIDGKMLHDQLFAQAKDFAEGKIKLHEADKAIRAIIHQYLGKTGDIAIVQ